MVRLFLGLLVLLSGGCMGKDYSYIADIGNLMDIVINSLYNQKDVFLRELISNASDAIERLRIVRLASKEAGNISSSDEKGIITVEAVGDTVVVGDNGIGMDAAELNVNLGTVALSGTDEFVSALQNEEDKNLIGHFGVGFYSAFLVADRVEVYSQKCVEAGGKPNDLNVWTSEMKGSYTVESVSDGYTLDRLCGTDVVLRIKADSKEFVKLEKLKSVATHYSKFVDHPIYFQKGDESKRLNTQKAIWLREPNEPTKKEYAEFFETLEVGKPIATLHLVSDPAAEIQFRALLFVPDNPPRERVNETVYDKKSQIQLYVKRILVAEKFEQLLPQYLSFVVGVVDCSSLPLNVSRQTLVNHKHLFQISHILTGLILKELRKIFDASNEEVNKYVKSKGDVPYESLLGHIAAIDKGAKVYRLYQENLMMGCVQSKSFPFELTKTIKVYSTLSPHRLQYLEEYILEVQGARKSKTPSPFYYYTTSSMSSGLSSPIVRAYTLRGIPVLILIHPLEETCLFLLSLNLPGGFMSVESGDPTADDDTVYASRLRKLRKSMEPFCAWFQKTTEHLRIAKVEISARLLGDPIAISNVDKSSAHLDALAKMRRGGDTLRSGATYKEIGLNPYHELVSELYRGYRLDPENGNLKVKCEILVNAGLLAGQFFIPEPVSFANTIFSLLRKNGDLESQHENMSEAEILEAYDLDHDEL